MFHRPLTLSALFAALALAAGALAADPAHVVPSNREQVTLTFAPVVKKAVPAVVNIYTRRVERVRPSPLFNDPFFQRFFGEELGVPRERVQSSLGSGVIVRSSGVIITNHHVVDGATQITVVLSDRREYEAHTVGTDQRSDLAVLQLDGLKETLPALDLANSDDLEVGDLVLAIGDPFGVGQTVTSGIVSALARTSVGTSDFRSFIQTDAAINPGNSGGALITSDGRLVGINSTIFSGNGSNIGIGFAIPANMVRSVLASILKEGKAVRPWLGASGKTVTSDLAKSLGLPRPMGVIIDRIVVQSPAARGGLAVGDIVQSVAGRDVNDAQELRYQIATLPVGATADLRVQRAGNQRTISVSLEAPPDDPPRDAITSTGRQPFAGATIANFNPALADELGVDYDEPGVMVLAVESNSIAARLGLRPGDRVRDINGAAVITVRDLTRAAGDPQAHWNVTIKRNGRDLQISVDG